MLFILYQCGVWSVVRYYGEINHNMLSSPLCISLNTSHPDFIHISIRDGYVFLNFMLDNEELELDLYYNQADGTEHTLEVSSQRIMHA